jgi:hypothetical protein
MLKKIKGRARTSASSVEPFAEPKNRQHRRLICPASGTNSPYRLLLSPFLALTYNVAEEQSYSTTSFRLS